MIFFPVSSLNEHTINLIIRNLTQIDNGVPVHLKGGMMDYVLYYATLLGCGIGLGMCGHYYYTAAFPKKS